MQMKLIVTEHMSQARRQSLHWEQAIKLEKSHLNIGITHGWWIDVFIPSSMKIVYVYDGV